MASRASARAAGAGAGSAPPASAAGTARSGGGGGGGLAASGAAAVALASDPEYLAAAAALAAAERAAALGAVADPLPASKSRVLRQLEEEGARRSFMRAASRAVLSERWGDRTFASPLGQDLVAQQERSEADLSMRNLEARRQRADQAEAVAQAAQAVAGDISQPGDSEVRALREQRRLIDLEERRLRGLLQIEKDKLVRKEDQLAAALALKHRKEQKLRARRALFAELQQKRKDQEFVVQKIHMGIEPPPPELIRGLRELYAPRGSYFQRDARSTLAASANAADEILAAAAFAQASGAAADETGAAAVALAAGSLAADSRASTSAIAAVVAEQTAASGSAARSGASAVGFRPDTGSVRSVGASLRGGGSSGVLGAGAGGASMRGGSSGVLSSGSVPR